MPATMGSLQQAPTSRVTVSTARTASYSGTAFDTIDYDGTGKVVMDVGTVSGTTPTCDFKLTESDTSGGTYADITGATASQITATGVREIAYDVAKAKRWIKVAGTIAGPSASFAA